MKRKLPRLAAWCLACLVCLHMVSQIIRDRRRDANSDAVRGGGGGEEENEESENELNELRQQLEEQEGQLELLRLQRKKSKSSSNGNSSNGNSNSNSDILCRDAQLRELRRYCRSDRERLDFLLSRWEGLVNLKDFYRALESPMRSVCYSARAVGGFWYFGIGQNTVSGERWVCADDLLKLEEEQDRRCLVYAMGVGEEISFDEEMASLYGCEVHAYDRGPHPEVVRRHGGGRRGIRLHRKHVHPDLVDSNWTTLEHEVERNGHASLDIDYLKVDVEGAELELLESWLRKGSLRNVRQLGVEVHSAHERLQRYFTVVRGLYREGFVHFGFNPFLAGYPAGRILPGAQHVFDLYFVRRKLPCDD